jgi:hypothetical protein
MGVLMEFPYSYLSLVGDGNVRQKDLFESWELLRSGWNGLRLGVIQLIPDCF